MPYAPTTWVDGTTPQDAALHNNLETQYSEATLSLNQDLFAAYVLDGLVCTKDGSVANQLDYTAGDFYIKQTDGTLRRRSLTASHFTTTVPSTTYFFDVNPDGTTSFATSHSAVTNHMAICSVTTDGSHNILVVTDARQLQVELLNLAIGGLFWNNDFHLSGKLFGSGGVVTIGDHLSLDSGAITSDGAGHLTAHTLTATTGGVSISGGGLSVTSGSTSLDNGAVTTNGSGTITASVFSGALSGNASTASSVAATAVQAGTLGSGVGASYVANTGFPITGTGGAGLVLGHTTGAAAMTIAAQGVGVAIGFKNNGIAGVKLAEIKSSGAMCTFGGFSTTGGSGSIATGASFDTFDVSEAYPVDKEYEAGTVVCPHGDVFSICEHDNCHAASIVSTGGALNIGGDEFSYDPADEPVEPDPDPHAAVPIALVGRVVANTRDHYVASRDLLCSDGNGGVRRVRFGEAAFTLGYALNSPKDGRVGVYVRPMWVGGRNGAKRTARASNRD